MIGNPLFPSPKTSFRESKDMAKVPWKVPLEVEGERSLLHVCADLPKDHAWVVGGRDELLVLLPIHCLHILMSAKYAPIDHKEKKNDEDKVFGNCCNDYSIFP